MGLGPDAIILKTRRVSSRGVRGVFGREEIEVTAATPDSETTFRPVISAHRRPKEGRRQPSIRDPEGEERGSDRAPQGDEMVLERVRDEMRELKTAFEGIRGTVEIIGDRVKYGDVSEFPEALRELLVNLVENGVEKNLAGQLLEEVLAQANERKPVDRTSMRESLVRRMADRFHPERQIPSAALASGTEEEARPFVIAFLGPTGVGKTTTLEKLAMRMKAQENRDVAILCCDTCKIAASKELEAFGELMEIPVEAVYTPEEMVDLLRQYGDRDVVLIDTAGRGATGSDVLQEIEDFMRQGRPDEVHLVLSATTKYEDLLNILRRFENTAPNYLLFTKLDETTSCGTLLNLAAETGKPISYVTWAPGIAEGMEPLDPFKMAEQIIGDHEARERTTS